MNIIVLLLATAVSDPSFLADSVAALNNRASQLYGQAHYDEAEELYRKAIEIPAPPGTDAARVHLAAARNLATLLRVTGRYQEAGEMLSQLLSQLENQSAAPVEVLRTLENLAGVHQAAGDYLPAESFANRAMLIASSNPEIGEHDRVNVRLLRAAIRVDLRRYDEAEAELNSVLPSSGDAQALIAYNALTAIAIQRGMPADAERFARLALERAMRGQPKNQPSVAMVLNNLAQACRFQEKYLEAENYYRQAIEQWEASLGPSHPDLAKGLLNLAAFYHERGREAGAEALYHRAEEIFDRALGRDSTLALVARNERADTLRGERRYAEADRLGAESLASLEKRFRPDDPRVLRALGNRARLLSETKRQAEAARVLDRLRRITAAAFQGGG